MLFFQQHSSYVCSGIYLLYQVKEIEQNKKRFLVSLKLSECSTKKNVKTCPTNIKLLQDLLAERKLIMENLATRSGTLENISEFDSHLFNHYSWYHESTFGLDFFFFFFMSRLAIRSSDCHIWDLSPVPRVPRVKA